MARKIVAQNSMNLTRGVLKQIRTKTAATVTAKELIVDVGDGAEPATTANTASADVVLGVCMQTVTSAAALELTEYDANTGVLYEMPFTNAGTKKTFTAADVGAIYQLAAGSAYVLDPDNTTNGFLELVGYDNDDLVAIVRLLNRKQGVN